MDVQSFDKRYREVPYPERLYRPRFSNLISAGTSAREARAFAVALEKYEAQKPEFLVKEKEYRKKLNLIEEEFKQALFEDLGISDNPKRELLYSKAYEMGHSSGFSNIYSYASDLVELID